MAGAEEQSLSSKDDGMWGTWEGSGKGGSSSLVEAPSCEGAATGLKVPTKVVGRCGRWSGVTGGLHGSQKAKWLLQNRWIAHRRSWRRLSAKDVVNLI